MPNFRKYPNLPGGSAIDYASPKYRELEMAVDENNSRALLAFIEDTRNRDDRLMTRELSDEESVLGIALIMACMSYDGFKAMCIDMGLHEKDIPLLHKWVMKHARRNNEDREFDRSRSETSETHNGGTSQRSISGDLLGSEDAEPLD